MTIMAAVGWDGMRNLRGWNNDDQSDTMIFAVLQVRAFMHKDENNETPPIG